MAAETRAAWSGRRKWFSTFLEPKSVAHLEEKRIRGCTFSKENNAGLPLAGPPGSVAPTVPHTQLLALSSVALA